MSNVDQDFAMSKYASREDREKAMSEEITRLRAELAAVSVYKPCRRTNTPHVPVKAIGECNEPFWFKGIRETDAEFAERAGKPYQEATE